MSDCLEYLRDNLHFRVGPREKQGLQLFHRHAVELGLVDADVELSGIPNDRT